MHDNRSRPGASMRPRVISFVTGALLAAGTLLTAPLASAQARPPLPPGPPDAGTHDSMASRPPRATRGATRPGMERRRDPRVAGQPGVRRQLRPGGQPGMGQGMDPRIDPRMRPRRDARMRPRMEQDMGRGARQGMRPGMGQPPMGPAMGRPMVPGRGRADMPGRPTGRRMTPGMAPRGGNPAENLLRMRDRLSLTDDQVRRLERLAGTPAPAVRGSDRLRAQEDLRAAMQGEGNVEAARSALERISRLRNEEVLAGLRARQEARRVLTDAQRRQLDGRRDDASGRRSR